jgi:hypothetical protein
MLGHGFSQTTPEIGADHNPLTPDRDVERTTIALALGTSANVCSHCCNN